MVKAIVLASTISTAVADITLASFGPSDATYSTWKQQNDPVMGGASSGTWSQSADYGTMEGTCAIIPRLKVPGFIKATTSGTYADVSSCTGIELEVRSDVEYAGYRFNFGSDKSSCGKFFARGYKADFTAPVGSFGKVQIPFNTFTNCWDDGSGDAIVTCADDSSKCPTESRLQNLQTLSVWAEGFEGTVKLDLKSVGTYGCGDALPNIVELAQSVPDLATLVAAVVAGDLVTTLTSPGPFTVFAPTNDAFGALPAGTLDTLLKPENKATLVDILTYHVLSGQVLSTDLAASQVVATVEGKNIKVTKDASGVKVGANLEATVVAADNLASNGVAHIIDAVMLPPSALTAAPTLNIVELAQSVDSLSTLVAAVVAGDLVTTLTSPGPFTVFAPTNDAFGALPAGTLDTLLKPENKATLVDILTYHVLSGQVLSTDLAASQVVATVEGKNIKVTKDASGVKVGANLEATVVAADNLATNGVAHIIDAVMLPPSGPILNIVELAQSVDSLSTLVAAVVAGDLVTTLTSPGPFTVFAPTNDAFGALPAGTLDTLLKPENKATLVDILTFHVLPAQVLSTDLKYFQRVQTVEGKNVHVYRTRKGVFVSPDGKDFKTVVGADNLATNGVAHIIDGVLLPPSSVVV